MPEPAALSDTLITEVPRTVPTYRRRRRLGKASRRIVPLGVGIVILLQLAPLFMAHPPLLTLLLTFATVFTVRGQWNRHTYRASRRARRLRALCTQCMLLESFRVVCGECLLPMVPAPGSIPEAPRARCMKCNYVVLGPADPRRIGICRECRHQEPATALHRRLVLLGTLSVPDYQLLRVVGLAVLGESGEPPDLEADQIRHSVWRDEDRVLCILSLADLPDVEGVLPETHAARQPDLIWLAGRSPDTLALGQALDAYFRRSGIDSRAAFPVCLEAREIGPVTTAMLEQRFTEIRLGVSAEAVMSTPPRNLAEPLDRFLAVR